MDLVGHLGAVDRASLFDAFEHAATRIGLATFVVHLGTPPTVIYASELLGELLRRPIDQLVGRPPWELVAPALREGVRELIQSRGPGASPIAIETEIERPDGTRRAVEVGVARITTDAAELAVCYFRDATAEHAALAAVQRSEAEFRSLIENAPDAIVILQQGRIVLANKVAVRMFGRVDADAVRGRTLDEFMPHTEAARAAERIGMLFAGRVVESSEYRLNNGLIGEVHSTIYQYDGKPSVLAFVRDTTERRRMQDQLFHADRLSALGRMAATVAHEINNPLTYLQLNLQRLERVAATDPDPARAAVLREHLAHAMHGVERVARIVRDLRVYSRDHRDEPEGPVDVVAVVDRALRMVEHDLRHRAQLARRVPDEPTIVDGSAGWLEQVVINLLVNAIQALEGSRNEIIVEIDAGDDVRITVSDTGPGLPDPERVFEPFFTTKGEGTGLGLSVCKQLVERMRGRIEVVRTGPRGTTLAVVLPRRRAAAPPPAPPDHGPRGERLRVLVIDDEPQVCAAIENLLATDHDVESVGSGESALAVLGARSYDVILCDLMMPRMNGREVYEQVRARWPGLERRVVFVTGGAFVPALAGFLETVENLKLRKPFTVEHVLALLREAHRR